MTRRACLVLAVAAGLAAAFLLASGPTVHYDGKTAMCPGIIATDAGQPVGGGGGVGNIVDGSSMGRGYVRACDDKQREWSVLAGLAALVSVAAGSVAYFSGRDRERVAVGSQ
jgi:hypothetical protein